MTDATHDDSDFDDVNNPINPEENDVLPPVETLAVASFELIAKAPDSRPRLAQEIEVAQIQEIKPIPSGDAAAPVQDLAVLDSRGKIYLFDDAETLGAPLIDLAADDPGFFDLRSSSEDGVRSIAFHPEFATPDAPGYGKVYVAYTATIDSAAPADKLFEVDASNTQLGFDLGVEHHDVLREFTVADPSDPVLDFAASRVVLRIEQPQVSHNIGEITFNLEANPGDADYGLLFIGVPDGATPSNFLNTAQDLGTAHGTIFRINPLPGPDGAPYTVPDDNPFLDTPGALPEIGAYGLRNPQKLSFSQGQLFIGEISEDTLEEINIFIPGANYGWDVREGTFLLQSNDVVAPLPDPDGDFTYPFVQYDHEEIGPPFAATGGGFIYEGTAIPELQGQFVFTDFPSGRVFTTPIEDLDTILADGQITPDETKAAAELKFVDAQGAPITFLEETAAAITNRSILRLAVDPDGELLAYSEVSGEIFRIVPGTEGAFEAVDDAVEAPRGTSTAIDVLANDIGLAFTAPEVTILSQPRSGVVEVADDQTITFTAPERGLGKVSFDYEVAVDGATDQARVTVDLARPNERPVTNPDLFFTEPGVPIELDFGSNDVDPERGPLIFSVSEVFGGSVDLELTNPVFTVFPRLVFTPNDGFEGSARIAYLAADVNGALTQGIATVAIGALFTGLSDTIDFADVRAAGKDFGEFDALDGNDVVTLPRLGLSEPFTGGAGNDTLIGRSADDTLLGGEGRDDLFGGRGRDRLEGGPGDDTLDGGHGMDTLLGGAGNDVLRSEGGRTVYTGGAGADIFVVAIPELPLKTDGYTVTDFEDGTDRIDVSLSGASDISDLRIRETLLGDLVAISVRGRGVESVTYLEDVEIGQLGPDDFIFAG